MDYPTPAGIGPAVAGAPSTSGADQRVFKEMLDELLPGMGAEKIPDRRQPQQKLQQVCLELGAPGREAERAAACKAIAGRLGPQTAKPARIWLLKQLERIGRRECVDPLAALLEDDDARIRECARRALQNNPAPEANAKLLAALAKASESKWKVALANALGYRADRASAGRLGKLLDDNDQAVAAAAAGALGKITGPEAAKVLATAESKTSGKLQVRIADAYLRCADALIKQGKRDEAAAIYKQMYRRDKPRTIRLAALQGILNATGK